MQHIYAQGGNATIDVALHGIFTEKQAVSNDFACVTNGFGTILSPLSSAVDKNPI
jgi:hypothetical protein